MTGLQKILEDADISRRELARRVGISHTRINDACNGSETGGLSMQSLGAVARELAAATGRSPGDILEAVVMPVALPPPDPESAD